MDEISLKFSMIKSETKCKTEYDMMKISISYGFMTKRYSN